MFHIVWRGSSVTNTSRAMECHLEDQEGNGMIN